MRIMIGKAEKDALSQLRTFRRVVEDPDQFMALTTAQRWEVVRLFMVVMLRFALRRAR